MVRINEKYQFNVYDLDTQQSAIERLAAEMNTIPRYLYFPNGTPDIKDFHNRDGNIYVEDILEIITSDSAGYDFVSVFNNLKDKIEKMKLDLRIDIFLPFIAFNKTLKEQPPGQMRDMFILLMQTELDKSDIFSSKQNIQKIWDNDRSSIASTITNGINANKKKVEKEKSMFRQFENISSNIPYSPFELENVNFEFTLDMVHITIMEVFNHIQLNTEVPFACINRFFKILKDFIPPEEWSVYLEDAIVFKILQTNTVSSSKISDYTNAVLAIVGEPGNEVMTVGMSLMTSRQYLTREKLIERFIDTIKGLGQIKLKTIKENRVNGVFYFPNHSINKYVMSDLIMNNPLFSSMMAIDESDKASKKKESIYIHFHHFKIGHVAANITEKIAEKGDPALRGKDVKGDFKFGTKYIRVKISSADNLKSVEVFQDLFSKLMVVYDTEYQNIVEFYQKYIPDFAKVVDQPTIPLQKLKLKDIAPEVFIKGYPPKCPHQPTIIGDDEVEEQKAAGKIVMRYPQNEDEGFIPRNYVCNYDKAKYPGLRSNPLSNRNIVPYLPCCYTKDHNERKGSIYRHYYHGEDLLTNVNEGQQDLIITNKFVPCDKYGTLPEDITMLFNIFDYNEGYMYVRKGVFNNKSSFLNCVMEGMYEETDILDLDDKDEREARLYQIREQLANPANAASCRQEMYDFTTKEIIAAIGDPNVYMDPKLFTAMLEDFFNCNIYVFDRTNIRSGQLAIPRHLQAYYKRKRKAKSIFIYEHYGSTSDHAKYPRCELIVRWRIGGGKEEDVSYYSPYNSKVSQGIREVSNRLRKEYALNREISDNVFPIDNPSIKLLEQGIDSYGKCRMIRFRYKRKIGTLLTSPLQPLTIPEVKGWIATKIDQDLAIEFAAFLNFPITGQSVVHDVVKEIYGILGNVRVSIPIEDSIPIDGIPISEQGISYPESEVSVIENFNRYKKLSRYITEYTFWLFSHYLQDNSTLVPNLETIQAFVDSKIKIVSDFEYGHVSKIFSNDSGVMKGGKLILKSEEALKRLIYTLRVCLRRFRQKILNYHSRKVIENYYLDVTDFDQYQFQVVLQGDESVEKWIQEHKIKHSLYDSVQVGLQTPYFFKNDLIGSQIYLAQNTHDVYKAIEIAKVWLQSGYNLGSDPDKITEKLVNFQLYSYVNEKDITPYNVAGIQTSLDIRMLGYKIDGNSFFTVLLPLG